MVRVAQRSWCRPDAAAEAGVQPGGTGTFSHSNRSTSSAGEHAENSTSRRGTSTSPAGTTAKPLPQLRATIQQYPNTSLSMPHAKPCATQCKAWINQLWLLTFV